MEYFVLAFLFLTECINDYYAFPCSYRNCLVIKISKISPLIISLSKYHHITSSHYIAISSCVQKSSFETALMFKQTNPYLCAFVREFFFCAAVGEKKTICKTDRLSFLFKKAISGENLCLCWKKDSLKCSYYFLNMNCSHTLSNTKSQVLFFMTASDVLLNLTKLHIRFGDVFLADLWSLP